MIHCTPFGMVIGSSGPINVPSILTSTGFLQGPLNSTTFKQNRPLGTSTVLGVVALHALTHASHRGWKSIGKKQKMKLTCNHACIDMYRLILYLADLAINLSTEFSDVKNFSLYNGYEHENSETYG